MRRLPVGLPKVMVSTVASGNVKDYVGPSDICSLGYTSGTTGKPKGVVYSHRALVLHSMACAMGDTLGLKQSDK